MKSGLIILSVSYWIHVRKQRKLIKEKARDDSRSAQKRRAKEKRWENKVATFYYVRASAYSSPARQTMKAS